MSFIAAAVIVGGGMALGAAGAFFGGGSASDAAGNAADTALQGTDLSISAQERMLQKQIDLQEPFRQAGLDMLPGAIEAGNAGYAGLNKMVDEAFTTKNGLSPAGSWQLEQTQRENENALAARGLSNSGAGLELNRRTTTDIAGRDYQDSWNRKVQATAGAVGASPLGQGSQAAAGMGQGATQAGANMGSTISSGYNTAGQYGLSGGLATGEMYQNMGGLAMGSASGLAKSYGQYMGYGGSFFAEGGRPPVGQDIIVGEEGPERIRLDQPGTVIPNPQTQARMAGRPGAGLNRGQGGTQPDKQDWLELEAVQSQEIRAAIAQLDGYIQMEGPSLEYLEKRDKLQKMLTSSIQRVEKGTEPKKAAVGGKKWAAY